MNVACYHFDIFFKTLRATNTLTKQRKVKRMGDEIPKKYSVINGVSCANEVALRVHSTKTCTRNTLYIKRRNKTKDTGGGY